MAIFRLQIGSLSRSDGRRAVNAAAYRAGERIRDERTGIVFDHSKRTDVLHSAIVLPSALENRELSWSQTRAALWNAAERSERRSNARVAREYEVALPAELTQEQRVDLTMAFAREIAERYQVVVDTTIHAPRPGSDQRNYHAHLLSTTREATVEGLGKKSHPELSDTVRRERRLTTSRQEFRFMRERWATLTNEALRDAGLEVRVDHRSLAAQGIDREPTPRIPVGALREERLGRRSEIADRIRERYRERVAARAERAAQAARVAQPAQAAQLAQAAPLAQAAQPTQPARAAQREASGGAQYSASVAGQRDAPSMSDRPPGVDGRRGPSLEEVRREAREAWVQFRSKARDEAAAAQKGMTLQKDSVMAAESHRTEGPEKEVRLRTGAELDAAF